MSIHFSSTTQIVMLVVAFLGLVTTLFICEFARFKQKFRLAKKNSATESDDSDDTAEYPRLGLFDEWWAPVYKDVEGAQFHKTAQIVIRNACDSPSAPVTLSSEAIDVLLDIATDNETDLVSLGSYLSICYIGVKREVTTNPVLKPYPDLELFDKWWAKIYKEVMDAKSPESAQMVIERACKSLPLDMLLPPRYDGSLSCQAIDVLVNEATDSRNIGLPTLIRLLKPFYAVPDSLPTCDPILTEPRYSTLRSP